MLRRLRRRGEWLVVAALVVGLSGAGAKPPAGTRKDAESGVKSSREASKLLSQFRRAKGDPAKQAQLIDEAIAAGPAAVLSLQRTIFRELYPQIERYRTRFQQQAAGYGKTHPRPIDRQEIIRLRQPVLELVKGEPTKDEIVAKGDPAITRLTEMFVIPRAEVLTESKDLQSEREKLETMGRLWEQCVAAIAQDAPPDGGEKRQFHFTDYLDGEEEIAASLAVPMDPKTQQVLAANARLAGQLDPEEARTVLALNLTRNLLGLPGLLIDLKLAAAARDHSKDMEEKKFFAHESPVPGKKTPWDRAARFGTSASGENIFMGSPDGKAANQAWFHSPGHFKNMLGNHQRVGVGRSGVYFTELFGN